VTQIDVLHGRGLLDATQRDALALIANSIRKLSRNLGPKPDAVEGLWSALTGAAISAQGVVPAGVGPAADQSRYAIRRMLRRLNGSTELVLQLVGNQPTPLVIRALGGQLLPADEIDLARLRDNLDRVASRR